MTYTEIIETVKGIADRPLDVELDTIMDSFITLTEANVNRNLRIDKMSTTHSIDTIEDTKSYNLPDDFGSIRVAKLAKLDPLEEKIINYVTPEGLEYHRHGKENGIFDITRVYTLINQKIHLSPTINSGFQLRLEYYQVVPHLSSSNTTNWLSNEYPDIYINGLLYRVKDFVGMPEQSEFYKTRFMELLNDTMGADSRDTWGSSSLTMQADNHGG